LLNFFYNDRILGQAGRKIGESVGSISRGPTPVCKSRICSENRKILMITARGSSSLYIALGHRMKRRVDDIRIGAG
jgi:hypothetical protein